MASQVAAAVVARLSISRSTLFFHALHLWIRFGTRALALSLPSCCIFFLLPILASEARKCSEKRYIICIFWLCIQDHTNILFSCFPQKARILLFHEQADTWLDCACRKQNPRGTEISTVEPTPSAMNFVHKMVLPHKSFLPLDVLGFADRKFHARSIEEICTGWRRLLLCDKDTS